MVTAGMGSSSTIERVAVESRIASDHPEVVFDLGLRAHVAESNGLGLERGRQQHVVELCAVAHGETDGAANAAVRLGVRAGLPCG